jgi:hypothetical protein
MEVVKKAAFELTGKLSPAELTHEEALLVAKTLEARLNESEVH